MRWLKKKRREFRYARLVSRVESRINARLQKWSEQLQVRTDRMNYQAKLSLLMLFIIVVSVLCSLIIYNALK